jgi:hypothetical protein
MLSIGHFYPIRYQHVLRLSIDEREGDQMAYPAVCIHEWLFLGIRFTFRLLMTMLVVPKVPSGRGFLVLTIACAAAQENWNGKMSSTKIRTKRRIPWETVRGAWG